jgi:hypothetical protein
MDLVTTAIIIREATKTAFAVKEIYSNSNPDKDGQLADLIASIPTEMADLAFELSILLLNLQN